MKVVVGGDRFENEGSLLLIGFGRQPKFFKILYLFAY